MKEKKWTALRLGEALEGYFAGEEAVHTPAGLAVWLGMEKPALERLAREDGRGGALLRMALTRMEKELLENGLRGKYNATMTSFALKCVFGYRDKPEETSAPGPVRVEVSDELRQYAV